MPPVSLRTKTTPLWLGNNDPFNVEQQLQQLQFANSLGGAWSDKNTTLHFPNSPVRTLPPAEHLFDIGNAWSRNSSSHVTANLDDFAPFAPKVFPSAESFLADIPSTLEPQTAPQAGLLEELSKRPPAKPTERIGDISKQVTIIDKQVSGLQKEITRYAQIRLIMTDKAMSAEETQARSEVEKLTAMKVRLQQEGQQLITPLMEEMKKVITTNEQLVAELAKHEQEAKQKVPLDLMHDSDGFQAVLKSREALRQKAIKQIEAYNLVSQQLNVFNKAGFYIQDPSQKDILINPADKTFQDNLRRYFMNTLNTVLAPSKYEEPYTAHTSHDGKQIPATPLWSNENDININGQGSGFGICSLSACLTAFQNSSTLSSRIRGRVNLDPKSGNIIVTNSLFKAADGSPLTETITREELQRAEVHGNIDGDLGLKALILAWGKFKLPHGSNGNATGRNTLSNMLNGLPLTTAIKLLAGPDAQPESFSAQGEYHDAKGWHFKMAKADVFSDNPEASKEAIKALKAFQAAAPSGEEDPKMYLFAGSPGSLKFKPIEVMPGNNDGQKILAEHAHVVTKVQLVGDADNPDIEQSQVTVIDPHNASSPKKISLKTFLSVFSDITIYKP